MATRKKKQHPLRAYIEEHADAGGQPFGRTHPVVVRLSEASGISAEAIYRVARGDYNLKPANAMALSKATGGEVSSSILVGLG